MSVGAAPPAPRGGYWRRPEVWLAFALLLTFILPWLQLGAFATGSGLQLAGLPFLLDDVRGAFAQPDPDPAATQSIWVLHLLYLLPLAAIATLVLAALRKPWRAAALLAGLMPWAAIAYAFSFDLDAVAQQAGQAPPPAGHSLFDVLGIGAYGSLLAGLLLALRALGLLGRR